jgi:phenylalanyl-tRNA synthetase beta chain
MKIEDRKKRITPDLTTEKMKISLENVNKLLGINLKEKEMVNLLNKMGHEYKKGIVFVPAWRTDILHEVDLIEDIAIAYGYDNFDSEIPELSTIGEESKENKLKSKIAELLIGLNLLEISSYHLMKKEEVKKMKLKNILEVENSKTEYKVLRQDLLSSVLRVLSKNKDKEYPQNIFEIGKVFSQDETKETGINEQTNLIIALTPGNFTEIKQHLEYLGKMLDLSYNIKETTQQGLIEGRTGNIILHDKEIGHFGEVHPTTLKTWNLKMPLAILELNLDEVIEKIVG